VSLLFEPVDRVLVYTEVDGTDGDGNPVKLPSEYPTLVKGRVQPVTTSEDGVVGQEVGTVYKLLCRSFPAGAYARVVWQDRSWDVDGEPVRYVGSPSTAHVTVMLRARRPEVS
jgi:hypothetical protein